MLAIGILIKKWMFHTDYTAVATQHRQCAREKNVKKSAANWSKHNIGKQKKSVCNNAMMATIARTKHKYFILIFFLLKQYFMRESKTHIRFDYTSISSFFARLFPFFCKTHVCIYEVGILHSRRGPIFYFRRSFFAFRVCSRRKKTSANK